MLYGIQITKSVMLNRIAAEIDENIKQVKIEMRLCRHLAFKDLGIYVYDRGGDRNEIFRYFISCGLDFIVRMMQKRYLMYRGVREHILVLAAKCHTPHTSVVAFNASGEEKDTTIHYGAMPVRLLEDPDFPGMHEKDRCRATARRRTSGASSRAISRGGADGERVGEGIECAAYHVHNVDLTSKDSYKGKATWLCDPSTNVVGSSDSWQDCDTKIANLFIYNAAQNNFPYLTSPVIDENNPASYLGFEFRFRDTDGPITGYNFGLTTTGSGRPSDWTVEVSDDGKTWTTVDVRSDVTLPPNTYGIFWDGTIYTSNETPNPPPAETFHFMGYLREGLTLLATALSVQVDEDAKLNLKAFTGGQPVSTLTYDAALGAGEIENAVFAANGTLYYTSVSGKPVRGTVLPYVLTNCSGLDNLATWSVVINGKATAWRVSVLNGQLTLLPPGLFIVVE